MPHLLGIPAPPQGAGPKAKVSKGPVYRATMVAAIGQLTFNLHGLGEETHGTVNDA